MGIANFKLQIPSASTSTFIRPGFTLIELMIVSVLIVLVGMIVYNAFRQGFALWTRVQYTSRQEIAIRFLDRITRELKNSFQFNPVGFGGEADTIFFPSIYLKYDWDWSNKQGIVEDSDNLTATAISATPLPLITKVTYQYNKDDNTLMRTEEVYAYPDLDELKMDPYGLEKQISSRVILNDVDTIAFSYAISKTAELNFEDKFTTDTMVANAGVNQLQMPYAVKIDLALKEMKTPLSRTIFIPVCRSLKHDQ